MEGLYALVLYGLHLERLLGPLKYLGDLSGATDWPKEMKAGQVVAQSHQSVWKPETLSSPARITSAVLITRNSHPTLLLWLAQRHAWMFSIEA